MTSENSKYDSMDFWNSELNFQNYDVNLNFDNQEKIERWNFTQWKCSDQEYWRKGNLSINPNFSSEASWKSFGFWNPFLKEDPPSISTLDKFDPNGGMNKIITENFVGKNEFDNHKENKMYMIETFENIELNNFKKSMTSEISSILVDSWSKINEGKFYWFSFDFYYQNPLMFCLNFI